MTIMDSMEARQPYTSSEEIEDDSGPFEFSLETEAGVAEQELLNGRRSMAEMFIRNPAFKSEKAERALRKLKEAWKSAEEDLPEELKRELSHEHKDAQTAQDPVHISTILADAPSRQPGLASMTQPQSDDTSTADETDGLEHPLETESTSIYRQAIIAGFTSAVVVIIFVLFLVLR